MMAEKMIQRLVCLFRRHRLEVDETIGFVPLVLVRCLRCASRLLVNPETGETFGYDDSWAAWWDVERMKAQSLRWAIEQAWPEENRRAWLAQHGDEAVRPWYMWEPNVDAIVCR